MIERVKEINYLRAILDSGDKCGKPTEQRRIMNYELCGGSNWKE